MILSLLQIGCGVILLMISWIKLHWISMTLTIVLSVEATFIIYKLGLRHHVCTWGSIKTTLKSIRGLSQNHVIGQFSTIGNTLKRLVYLDKLDLYALPQVDKKDVIFLYQRVPQLPRKHLNRPHSHIVTRTF